MMDAQGREKRDAAIMRDIRAGKEARAVARKYALTYVRIKQIVARESKQHKRRHR